MPRQSGSEGPHTRSPETEGLGQSGYTAGRPRRDPALQRDIAVENVSYPRGVEAEELLTELGTDDRFTGRGGRPLDADERLRRAPPADDERPLPAADARK